MEVEPNLPNTIVAIVDRFKNIPEMLTTILPFTRVRPERAAISLSILEEISPPSLPGNSFSMNVFGN